MIINNKTTYQIQDVNYVIYVRNQMTLINQPQGRVNTLV
jgi:hypothetical protein